MRTVITQYLQIPGALFTITPPSLSAFRHSFSSCEKLAREFDSLRVNGNGHAFGLPSEEMLSAGAMAVEC
ncbi:unnamed protein product [Linum tenue]|uniref:Uncharacterized protein n=1 Tax=Linum tenue TaxID=586396 RepID=A0AAV0K8D4_9ROSI|nr:unnamed protein product [Linum tenue]